MPRYSFRFSNGKRVCSDADALELADDEAARKEAELAASDLWDHPGQADWSAWTIEVADENGRCVTSVPVDPGLKDKSSGRSLPHPILNSRGPAADREFKLSCPRGSLRRFSSMRRTPG
jgi:hypothetical protein